MIWIWILAGFLGFLILLLSLKTRFSGRAAPAGITLELHIPGYSFHYNSSTKSGQHKTSKAEKPKPSIRIETGKKKNNESAPKQRATNVNLRTFSPSLIKLIISRIFKLIRRIFRSIHAENICVRLTIATDDPMTTAMLYGALQPAVMFNNSQRKIDINVDFERQTPDYDVQWELTVRPIVWIWVFISWLATLPWLRIWRLYKETRRN